MPPPSSSAPLSAIQAPASKKRPNPAPYAGPQAKRGRGSSVTRGRSVTPIFPLDPNLLEAKTPEPSSSSQDTTRVTYSRWTDNVNQDGETADDILIEYLTEGTNYSQFKASNKSGRHQHAQRITELMHERNIAGFDRSLTSICTKVSVRCSAVPNVLSDVVFVPRSPTSSRHGTQQIRNGTRQGMALQTKIYYRIPMRKD